MTDFTGKSKETFGFIAFISHLLISLGVITVFVSLFGWLIVETDMFGYLIAGGGASVLTGIGFGFLNILFN